jgi:hypothetical protein
LSATFWQTVFTVTVGVQIPVITTMPSCRCSHHDSRPADARSSPLTPPVTMSPLPGITRESRRLTIGLSSNSRISSARTTTKEVKTQQVVRSRGQRCGDMELVACLADSTGPVNLAGPADCARALGPLLNSRKIFFFCHYYSFYLENQNFTNNRH